MKKLGKSLVLVVLTALGACGDFGGMEGTTEGEDAEVAVDAEATVDGGGSDTLMCAKHECMFQCDEGGTTNGNPLGPWTGCYCVGYRCVEWGPKACSVNTIGCVVLPPEVVAAGLP